MNTWRPGSSLTRSLFRIDGRYYTFKSEHPDEERLIELTDEYRDQDGNFIQPESVAWDGVRTCPGVQIRID